MRHTWRFLRHKGPKVLWNPSPFPWLNKGKLWENILETYYAKTCMYYTGNELACLVSGCPSTHHCRRTPTGSVRRTAAVQTNKCKWTTSKHIEENTKNIQKPSELLSREELSTSFSSTLLLFGLTKEQHQSFELPWISWLSSAVPWNLIARLSQLVHLQAWCYNLSFTDRFFR